MARAFYAVAYIVSFFHLGLSQDEELVYTECPNSCSGHGICGLYGSCTCQDMFYGSDCSKLKCPNGTAWVDYPTATNVAHGIFECSNMGTCDTATGTCECREGFTGIACERLKCLADESGLECAGNGRCMSMRMAAKIQNNVNLFRTLEYTNWDADKIWGCVCDKGFGGPLCVLKMCPTGDDPLTTSNTDNEVQTIDCRATSGTFRVIFRDYKTSEIAYNANAATIKSALEAIPYLKEGVTVAFDGGSAPCSSSGLATKITFTNQPGDLPTIQLSKKYLVHSTSANLVLNAFGGGATGTYGTPTATVNGNRENIECSGQGECDYVTGTCSCRSGFQSSNGAATPAAGYRGDCGYIATPPTTCDIDNELLNKCNSGSTIQGGVCTAENTALARCSCRAATTNSFGYSGAQCKTVNCPMGKPWHREAASTSTRDNTLEMCSGVGVCDMATGVCTCPLWAAGVACEKLACVVTGKTLCSGIGSCNPMSVWATNSRNKVTGNLLGISYTDSPSSWDHDRIYGCRCHRNVYRGPKAGNVVNAYSYACTRMSCPHGDIPETLYQQDEVQEIYCRATGGSFTLSFRGETTRPIAYNAVAMMSNENSATNTLGTGLTESVQGKLHYLTEILDICYDGNCSGVKVSFSSGSAVCADAGITTSVTFTSQFSDLPLLTIDASGLTGTVSTKVYEKVKGTKEYSECSNRGRCDATTGSCKCHIGYISSDGYGGIGQRADCGTYNYNQRTEGLDMRL